MYCDVELGSSSEIRALALKSEEFYFHRKWWEAVCILELYSAGYNLYSQYLTSS